ncbi:helix-turn-helix domain-containing protein [Arenibacter sp. BSSL-BM3]|uniref:Helix-turn-helix domain-containing protein n=1 Tax=Arenibacter arenosicollis TaxID=2762274 RepID=A0ABR7QQS3_9FLAO|nr:helix-turn-helix domain-containing protein [Arenibacter arenosicollis]MBC8769526.1 helix-turn-helix domain-containing protein [Arenibacter arenosicollis]
MDPEAIKISRIANKTTSKKKEGYYSVFWIQNGVKSLEIDKVLYRNVSNSIFFLHPSIEWKLLKENSDSSSGYILYLSQEILDNPLLSKLHINEIRLFASDAIPKINLSPGIEKRIQSILEMLDELIGSELNHKDDAIISLLNTIFVYCDGQCNIKSVISENNSKKALVYKFKKLVDKRFSVNHKVCDYAEMLNVSDNYLNECIKETIGVNAKAIITEKRIMSSRHQLKFTDKTIKEICYELGFSSPDYFSYFFKKHTGITPSMLREN